MVINDWPIAWPKITVSTDSMKGWQVITDASIDWSDCTCYYQKPTYRISDDMLVPAGPTKIAAGSGEIELPDGAKLIVDDKGNYRIEDKDAKVTYQANRIREFSPHLNASDMVAAFVRYVGGLGVKQTEVLGLPLELFINWLIIEAAERDKDPIPADVKPVDLTVKGMLRPKCLVCGRFVPRINHQRRFPFCGVEHGARYLQQQTPRMLIAGKV